MRWLLLMLLGLGAACGSPEGEATNDNVLSFSAIPDENQTELKEKYDPVAAYLSEEARRDREVRSVDEVLGERRDVQERPDSTGVVRRSDRLPGARRRSRCRAVAQGIEDPNYVSYSSPTRTPASRRPRSSRGDRRHDVHVRLRELDVGSLDADTSFEVRRRHADEFFKKKYQFSGAHDKTAYQVQDETVQVGALSYKTTTSSSRRARSIRRLQEDLTTPTYADYNFTAHPDLEKKFGEGFIDKLQNVLTSIEDPKILAAFSRAKMIPAKNEEFDGIVQTAKALKLLR